MFEIIISKTFSKEIKKLNKEDKIRISDKLLFSSENPLLFFQRMTKIELYKLRIGKFRVRAKIDFKNKKIYPLSVKKRKNVYKKHNKLEI